MTLGLRLFDEANGICLGYTCSLQMWKKKSSGLRPEDLPLGYAGLDLGKGDPLPTETWRQIWARPPRWASCSPPFSLDLLAGGTVSPSRLPRPGPRPAERLARERWVWRRRVRCSRAEKRSPAWRATVGEPGCSRCLDRTMFRFHHSTTWLDQAQRKAPAATGQSQGQEAAPERGQERSEEGSVEQRKPGAGPPRVMKTRIPQEHVQRPGSSLPSRPRPQADRRKWRQNRREATGPPTLELGQDTSFPRELRPQTSATTPQA